MKSIQGSFPVFPPTQFPQSSIYAGPFTTTQVHEVLSKIALSQHSTVGSGSCVPVTTQVHEVLSKVAVSQHSTVGSGSCVPVTTQVHEVLSKVAVSQQ